eukprot:COSAG02_NODE_6852_length_3328_cov_2.670486_2_plen_114_part_00
MVMRLCMKIMRNEEFPCILLRCSQFSLIITDLQLLIGESRSCVVYSCHLRYPVPYGRSSVRPYARLARGAPPTDGAARTGARHTDARRQEGGAHGTLQRSESLRKLLPRASTC